MDFIYPSVVVVLLLGLLGLLVIYLRSRKQARSALSRFADIINVEAERERISAEAARERDVNARTVDLYREEEAEFLRQDTRRREQLSNEYETALRRYKDLQAEVALLEESLNDISYGLYKPHFTYESPEEYKARIAVLRTEQREMIRRGEAVKCHTEWRVNNSRAEGQRMIKFYSKLMLRAFNGECEGAIASLSWNNAPKMASARAPIAPV